MHTRRLALSVSVLILLSAAAFAAPSIAPSVTLTPATSGAATTATLYLHAATPLGNLEELAELGGVGAGPTMDSNAPTTPAPKVTQASAGNGAYRKNFLLGYWSGALHGNVSNAKALLWIQPNAGGNVEVTLFGDGVIGVSPYLARSTVAVAAGPARLVEFPLTMPETAVDKELVLSVYAGTQGTALLYDAVGFESRLTFDLGPYVAPPVGGGTVWTAAPGWGDVHIVSTTQAHRETSLVINPVDEDVMIACTPSGVPATGNGHSYFHRSTDGGVTWAEMRVETADTDGRRYTFEGGDCDVAFDAAGTMYSADTWLGSLSVGASRDGGATWTGTPVAASSPIVDRPWLVGGPAGTIHVAYQDVQFGMPSAIWYTKSTDYGVTWQPAVLVTTVSPAGAFSWEGSLVVSDDQQDLYSIHTRRAGPAVGSLEDTGPESVWVSASHDGGLTWTERLVANMPNPASFLYPAMDMDAGGILHAVWAGRPADNADHPIWYSFSTDDAVTWSAPVKVRAGVGGYSPWIEGGAAGEAVIQWLGTPTAQPKLNETQNWFLYWGKVTGADTGAPAITSGTTTTTPFFVGKQTAVPEFNQVRLDSDGKMHIGASVFYDQNGSVGWAIFHQREL